MILLLELSNFKNLNVLSKLREFSKYLLFSILIFEILLPIINIFTEINSSTLLEIFQSSSMRPTFSDSFDFLNVPPPSFIRKIKVIQDLRIFILFPRFFFETSLFELSESCPMGIQFHQLFTIFGNDVLFQRKFH